MTLQMNSRESGMCHAHASGALDNKHVSIKCPPNIGTLKYAKLIVGVYKGEVIPCPTTQDEWREITDELQRKWNVSHACGVLDDKHVSFKRPTNTSTLSHNYKGFFSAVLLALVNAEFETFRHYKTLGIW